MPAVPVEPPREAVTAPPSSDALQGLAVLVVDDDEDARTLLKVLLGAAGADVSTASDAASALAALEQRVPHVLLSDVGMPGEHGYALIRRVRSHVDPAVRRLSAVAITGLARTQDRIELLRAGFQAHVCKPIEPSEVVALVGSLGGHLGPTAR